MSRLQQRCKYCRQPVPLGARKCGSCGEWLKKPLFSTSGIAVVAILLVAALLFVLYFPIGRFMP